MELIQDYTEKGSAGIRLYPYLHRKFLELAKLTAVTSQFKYQYDSVDDAEEEIHALRLAQQALEDLEDALLVRSEIHVFAEDIQQMDLINIFLVKVAEEPADRSFRLFAVLTWQQEDGLEFLAAPEYAEDLLRFLETEFETEPSDWESPCIQSLNLRTLLGREPEELDTSIHENILDSEENHPFQIFQEISFRNIPEAEQLTERSEIALARAAGLLARMKAAAENPDSSEVLSVLAEAEDLFDFGSAFYYSRNALQRLREKIYVLERKVKKLRMAAESHHRLLDAMLKGETESILIPVSYLPVEDTLFCFFLSQKEKPGPESCLLCPVRDKSGDNNTLLCITDRKTMPDVLNLLETDGFIYSALRFNSSWILDEFRDREEESMLSSDEILLEEWNLDPVKVLAPAARVLQQNLEKIPSVPEESCIVSRETLEEDLLYTYCLFLNENLSVLLHENDHLKDSLQKQLSILSGNPETWTFSIPVEYLKKPIPEGIWMASSVESQLVGFGYQKEETYRFCFPQVQPDSRIPEFEHLYLLAEVVLDDFLLDPDEEME